MKLKLVGLFVVVAIMAIGSFAEAKIIRVPADYPTIQAGIDAAVAGDQVVVAAGTYEKNIVLKSGVDVLGAGADVTTIVASETYVVYARTVTDMKFDGFKIDGIFKSAIGIYCENSSSFAISNNIITQCGNDGIDCIGASNATINNNVITQNWRMGIYIHDSDPIISDNTITQNGMHGIWCFLSSYPAITNNKITYNGDSGIQCSASSEPKIFWNEITNNNNGVYVYEDANPYIGTEKNPGMNAIYANTWYEVRNDTENIIMAEMNWWGQAPPFPSQFYGSVDYDPWLEESPFPTTGSITGIVTDATGNPIQGASVIAINSETKSKSQAMTDANGWYQILDLEPGIYWVLCIKKGYKAGIKKAEVIAGKEVVINFKLKK